MNTFGHSIFKNISIFDWREIILNWQAIIQDRGEFPTFQRSTWLLYLGNGSVCIWCLWRAIMLLLGSWSKVFFFLEIFFILFLFFKFYFIFTLQYCISFAKYWNESATGIPVFSILNPPSSSLPIPSLWVVPVHQPQASSIVHWTWTGDSFHTYYTCFNAILPNLPTLSLSHRVHKTDLYISVSFAVSYTGLLLPSF